MVGCVDLDICMKVCENFFGCFNIVYLFFILGLVLVGGCFYIYKYRIIIFVVKIILMEFLNGCKV